MSNEKEFKNESNDNLNFEDVSKKAVEGFNSLKKGFLSAMDVAKNKGQKAFADAKSNLTKTTEEKLAEAEKKLKSKLEENEKKVKLKIESDERIRQMKKDAEKRKKQEKNERLEKERLRKEEEKRERDRIKAIKREKRKAFFKKLRVFFILGVIAFIAYKAYQFVEFDKETERRKAIAEIEKQKQKELAEIEAKKQIEIASITEAEKKKRRDKNEFDAETNENVTIRLFDFSVPIYWTENKSKKDSYDGLAEIGDKIAELQISSLEDNELVSFDVLKQETLDGNMQKLFTQSGWFKGAEFVEYEKISTDAIEGYVYSYTCPYKGVDSVIKVLCFPSIDDNRWYYIALQESNNTSFSYISDFDKIVKSIKRNNNTVTKE